jgi:hypothetical protein
VAEAVSARPKETLEALLGRLPALLKAVHLSGEGRNGRTHRNEYQADSDREWPGCEAESERAERNAHRTGDCNKGLAGLEPVVQALHGI